MPAEVGPGNPGPAGPVDGLLGDCSLAALLRRRSMKWTRYPADVLPAWVAEMDFDLAEPVKQAVRDAIDAGDCGYPNAVDLGDAYAAFTGPRFGWAPDPRLVYAVPDVMTGIAEVLHAVTPPGSGVVINPPVYPPFFYRTRMSGRRVVEAPLRRDAGGRYHLDPAAVDAALSAGGAGAYLLCSPHNPTGRVWSPADLAAVAQVCARRDVVLLVDEIHAPLALPGAAHTPFLSLDLDAALRRRVFAFTSASKGWNIPGLKCGLVVAGHPDGARVIEDRWEALLASHLGVLATAAAFRHGGAWLAAVTAQLDQNRALLGRLLGEALPGVRYVPPEASFLAWLDCEALGLADPAAAFLARGQVALSPGGDFGSQGRQFARLNMGTSPELLAEIVRRMSAAVHRVRAVRG